MRTRSITHIHEIKGIFCDNEEPIVCSFYRHCDGYPSGHGDDLANWLKDKKLVNGIGKDYEKGKHFNRAGSMAVHLMAYIDGISGCEVLPTGSNDSGPPQYIYDIYYRDGFYIQVDDGGQHVTASAQKYDGKKIEEFWNEE